MRAATEPWGNDEVAFGAPDVDVIYHATFRDDLYFAVVSKPLRGSREQTGSRGTCPRLGGSVSGPWEWGGGGDPVDGAYAWIEGCDTPFGSDSVAIVATATRGYIIYLHVGEEPAAVAAARRIGRLVPASYEGDWFWAALQTVDPCAPRRRPTR
jgi:hypothetical protein